MTGMPRSSNFFFHARAFALSATSSGRGQCGEPLGPAAPTSTASMPRLDNLSSIWSNERSLKGGSKTPIGKLFLDVAGLSPGVDCADVGTASGADTSAAAVVPRNCRRFINAPRHGQYQFYQGASAFTNALKRRKGYLRRRSAKERLHIATPTT